MSQRFYLMIRPFPQNLLLSEWLLDPEPCYDAVTTLFHLHSLISTISSFTGKLKYSKFFLYKSNSVATNKIKYWFLLKGEKRSTRRETSGIRAEKRHALSTCVIASRIEPSPLRQPCSLSFKHTLFIFETICGR